MPFVKAQCTNCGGILEVDNDKDAAICPFCHTPYVVEKAINNYQINNKYEINNANITIAGKDVDTMVKDAEALLFQLDMLPKALKKYEEITQEYPRDYRGWWGLVVCKMKTNVKDLDEDENKQSYTKGDIESDINRAKVMNSSARKYIDNIYSKYLSYINDFAAAKQERQHLSSKERDEAVPIGLAYVLIGFGIFALIVSVVFLFQDSSSAWFGLLLAIIVFIIGGICFSQNKKHNSVIERLNNLDNKLDDLKKEYAIFVSRIKTSIEDNK